MQTHSLKATSEIVSTSQLEVAVDFGLEMVELELLLELKAEEGLTFDRAVKSALSSSGNEWLFDFPATRFPLPAIHCAAIRLRSGDQDRYCYVYQPAGSNEFLLAGDDVLGEDYGRFARSYAQVARALKPLMSDDDRSVMH